MPANPPGVKEAPPTLLDRFRERDGTLGRLAVITARPDAKLEVADNLQAFVEAGRNLPVNGKLVDATGDTWGTRGFKSHIGGRDYLQEVVGTGHAEAKVYHPHYKKVIDQILRRA